MLNIIFKVLFFVLISSYYTAYSQYTLNLQTVDLIIYTKDDTELRFFRKTKKGQFQEMDLIFDRTYHLKNIEYNKPTDLKDIKYFDSKSDVMLFKEQIKQTKLDELTSFKWLLNTNDYKKKVALMFLNNNVVSLQKFHFNTQYSGTKKWYINSAKFYHIVKYDLGNSKAIYKFIADLGTQGNQYVFLPLKSGNYLVSNYNDSIIAIKKTKQFKTGYLDNFNNLSSNMYLKLRKTGLKYKLVNAFGQDLIKSQYDTIEFNNYFILGKNKNNIDIYNLNFHKQLFKNVKSAYLYKTGLEVLTNNNANYYDHNLNKIEQFLPLKKNECGNNENNYYSYKIHTDSITKNKALTLIRYKGVNLHKITYFLKGVSKYDNITFLNDKKTLPPSSLCNPSLLKVSKDDKKGIVKFNYNYNFYKDKPTKIIKVNELGAKEYLYKSVNLNSIQVLPVLKDSIIFNKQDKQIYFFKHNKIGLLKLHKKERYSKIKQQTKSFYFIEKNNQKGWLNINTGQEYF